MPSLLAPTSARVCLGLAGLCALVLCGVPLLAVHGAESALLLGVLLPPMAAWVAARLTVLLRDAGGVQRVGQAFERALGYGALLFALPSLVLWLDALRIRNCTPGLGFAFMLLGPGFGTLLGSVVGVCAALCTRSARSGCWLALAVPLSGVGIALARFYATPAIFMYGHFYGYFPGTLYDEGVSITGPFLWLRVFSCAWLAGLTLLATSASNPATLRWAPSATSARTSSFALGLGCIAVALTAELFAPELGHASSVASLQAALGGELRSARCQLHFPREWSPRTRRRLADDCDFRVWQAERWLGVSHPQTISVFLFRSPEEKGALMGAADTNLAKPWRSESFISENGWPNPVLGHELVHVVAAATGRGPLRVTGRALGLWPDPALIEGVAMAAAWQTQAGLTPHEWARAMLELGMAPPLDQLFGAGFLAQARGLAYTLCGSLLRFVAERYGSASVRRAYASGDLAQAVGIPLSQLQTQWHAYLRSLPLAKSSLELARARFSGSSILSELCPHALAKLHDKLDADLAAGNDRGASTRCTQILHIDPADSATRSTLVPVLARLGDTKAAAHELGQLAPGGKPSAFFARAEQALADEAFRNGQLERAAGQYEALLQAPNDDDALRVLQVKNIAAHSLPRQRQLLFELLVGAPGERIEPASAVHIARELRAERSDGLALYLEARQLYNQKRFAFAAPLLARALAAGLPSPELSAEALHLLAISRFALGQLDEAAALLQRYASDGRPGHAAEAQDWLARIRFTRAYGARPRAP